MALFFLCIRIRIRRQFLQFFHEMADHAVAAQRVVLVEHIPHHLAVADREIPRVFVPLVTLIEAFPLDRHHRAAERLLFPGVFLQPLDLPSVQPGDHAQRQHAQLLHPVFAHNFADCLPVHSIPPQTRTHAPPDL